MQHYGCYANTREEKIVKICIGVGILLFVVGTILLAVAYHAKLAANTKKILYAVGGATLAIPTIAFVAFLIFVYRDDIKRKFSKDGNNTHTPTSEDDSSVSEEEKKKRKIIKSINICIGINVFFCLIGAVLLAVAKYANLTETRNKAMNIAGGIICAMFGVTAIWCLLIWYWQNTTKDDKEKQKNNSKITIGIMGLLTVIGSISLIVACHANVIESTKIVMKAVGGAMVATGIFIVAIEAIMAAAGVAVVGTMAQVIDDASLIFFSNMQNANHEPASSETEKGL